jgi:hypothetical protein
VKGYGFGDPAKVVGCANDMSNQAQLPEPFADKISPMIEEFFDSFVVVGYTADTHRKAFIWHPGSDPACADGIMPMIIRSGCWVAFDSSKVVQESQE